MASTPGDACDSLQPHIDASVLDSTIVHNLDSLALNDKVSFPKQAMCVYPVPVRLQTLAPFCPFGIARGSVRVHNKT